ncbi:MAG: hypothetical protein IPJ13_32010 [Saprospiraceae bacterium]|nr:hypothetical protein [Saprospiraceae bacterium]
MDISESLFGLFGGTPLVNNIKRRECTWINGGLQCADDVALLKYVQ